MCFSKKKKVVSKNTQRFLTLCVKGAGFDHVSRLEEIWNNALNEGTVDELINARDDVGDSPIHKTALYGHYNILKWMFEKDEFKKVIEVDEPDSQGYTPLFLACFKGYIGSEQILARDDSTKARRMKVVDLLLNNGAEPNYVANKVNMTPLHWAAYNDDAAVTRRLLYEMKNKGLVPTESASGAYPVDIAGFMKHKSVVNVYVDFTEYSLEEEYYKINYNEGAMIKDSVRRRLDHKALESVIKAEEQQSPSFNDDNLPINTEKSGVNEIGQRIVRLKVVKRAQLDGPGDVAMLRVFYWAAFYGYKDTIIDYMILYKRWSPFVKSYKKQSILTASIKGKKVGLVRLMSGYHYV